MQGESSLLTKTSITCPIIRSSLFGFLSADIENDSELTKSQNPMEHGATTTLLSVTPPFNDAPKKNRKKPKKKKKRPRHQQTSTTVSTMTPISETSPLTTTTDTWLTTPQWRLVAERLFGPRWQEDTRGEPENVPKIDSKPRILSSLRDLVDQNKSKNTLKTTNVEQKSLLSDVSGKPNTQLRLLGMRKINSHPLYLQDSRKFTPMTGRNLMYFLFIVLSGSKNRECYFEYFINN